MYLLKTVHIEVGLHSSDLWCSSSSYNWFQASVTVAGEGKVRNGFRDQRLPNTKHPKCKSSVAQFTWGAGAPNRQPPTHSTRLLSGWATFGFLLHPLQYSII